MKRTFLIRLRLKMFLLLPRCLLICSYYDMPNLISLKGPLKVFPLSARIKSKVLCHVLILLLNHFHDELSIDFMSLRYWLLKPLWSLQVQLDAWAELWGCFVECEAKELCNLLMVHAMTQQKDVKKLRSKSRSNILSLSRPLLLSLYTVGYTVGLDTEIPSV